MTKILGYGEDALTLWAIKEQVGTILKKFGDHTATSDCLVFYRPSFGRSGGAGSAEFGEFDAIITSKENIYLVEKGHNFLQLLEPIFDEFLAIVQNLEQRDERDFKYRQNRYKEIKLYPAKVLNALERRGRLTATPEPPQ